MKRLQSTRRSCVTDDIAVDVVADVVVVVAAADDDDDDDVDVGNASAAMVTATATVVATFSENEEGKRSAI